MKYEQEYEELKRSQLARQLKIDESLGLYKKAMKDEELTYSRAKTNALNALEDLKNQFQQLSF